MTIYYDEKIECIPQNQLKELQLKLFNQQLDRAKRANAYEGKLPDKIANLSEIEELPFTTKEDLRKKSPYGFLAISQNKVARFNATSGTTGEPVIVCFSQKDIDYISDRAARNHFMAGVSSGDIVQTIPSGNLFVGGWYFNGGSFKIGASILQTGPGNTEKQISFLKRLKPQFCFSTAGYFLHLLQTLSDFDLKEIALKGAIIGAEPTSSEAKKIIKEKYEIDLYDIYGFTEVGGPFAQDCSYHAGLHIPEDYFYCEIINPETGEILPDGEYGELIVTPLQQEAMPLIRYRTRDITRIIPGKCPCGRTHRRIEAITHRIDDMMIINGVNVFPSQIEECIYKHISTATNYLIHVTEKEGLKKLVVDIELSDDLFNNLERIKKLEKELIATIRACITVTPKLNFVSKGTLPEIQGKAKRVAKD